MITTISITTIVLIAAIALSVRFISLFPQLRPGAVDKHKLLHLNSPAWIVIVLGSGGHTAEMFAILRDLDASRFALRSYIVSSGDNFSAQKALEFEHQLQEIHGEHVGYYRIATVPRARRIHQSLLTTPISSFACLWSCLSVLRRPVIEGQPSPRPDLIITNGPGTGVIVVLASYILRFLRHPGTQGRMRTVYVESWARVKRLSLSGRILLPFVNRFIVQWEALMEATGGKGEYLGVLV